LKDEFIESIFCLPHLILIPIKLITVVFHKLFCGILNKITLKNVEGRLYVDTFRSSLNESLELMEEEYSIKVLFLKI